MAGWTARTRPAEPAPSAGKSLATRGVAVISAHGRERIAAARPVHARAIRGRFVGGFSRISTRTSAR